MNSFSIPFDKPEFSIVVINDTHTPITDSTTRMRDMANEIVILQDCLNIGLVVHCGDNVSDGSSATQWANLMTFYDTLDNANIPYLPGFGNHDSNPDNTRTSTDFNSYLPTTRLSTKSWWNGGFAEVGETKNSYLIIGNYLFMNLEYGPRQEIIDWANTIVSTNSSKRVFIFTHGYLYHDGTRTTTGDSDNPHDIFSDGPHDGQEMWDELVKLHSNIYWVQGGHHLGTPPQHADDTGNGGNKVHQVFINYQTLAIAIFRFNIIMFYSSGNRIESHTIYGISGSYSLDTNDRITVTFP